MEDIQGRVYMKPFADIFLPLDVLVNISLTRELNSFISIIFASERSVDSE